MPGVLTYSIAELRAVVSLYDCNIKKYVQKLNQYTYPSDT